MCGSDVISTRFLNGRTIVFYNSFDPGSSGPPEAERGGCIVRRSDLHYRHEGDGNFLYMMMMIDRFGEKKRSIILIQNPAIEESVLSPNTPNSVHLPRPPYPL